MLFRSLTDESIARLARSNTAAIRAETAAKIFDHNSPSQDIIAELTQDPDDSVRTALAMACPADQVNIVGQILPGLDDRQQSAIARYADSQKRQAIAGLDDLPEATFRQLIQDEDLDVMTTLATRRTLTPAEMTIMASTGKPHFHNALLFKQDGPLPAETVETIYRTSSDWDLNNPDNKRTGALFGDYAFRQGYEDVTSLMIRSQIGFRQIRDVLVNGTDQPLAPEIVETIVRAGDMRDASQVSTPQSRAERGEIQEQIQVALIERYAFQPGYEAATQAMQDQASYSDHGVLMVRQDIADKAKSSGQIPQGYGQGHGHGHGQGQGQGHGQGHGQGQGETPAPAM